MHAGFIKVCKKHYYLFYFYTCKEWESIRCEVTKGKKAAHCWIRTLGVWFEGLLSYPYGHCILRQSLLDTEIRYHHFPCWLVTEIFTPARDRCVMALTNIHSDWMSDASSGLGFFHVYLYSCSYSILLFRISG